MDEMKPYEAPTLTELSALPLPEHVRRVLDLRSTLPTSPVRAWLAIALADRLFIDQQPVAAQMWAFRGLHEGPRTDVFCLLGEIAVALDEHEQALRWYEQARACQWCPAPRLPLTADRLGRLIALCQTHPIRPVRHVQANRFDPYHHIAVMTTPDRRDLMPRTWASLVLAGHERWPGARHCLVDDDYIGQARMFLRALEWAASDPDLTKLTLFEDDVVLTKNALDYIATVEIDPDIAFVTWFHQYDAAPLIKEQRLGSAWQCLPSSAFCSNQGLTIPARTVRRLLASDALKNWPEPHGGDRVFGVVMPTELCALHVPPLVQHVGGEASLVGNTGKREAVIFPGEDFDALTLLDEPKPWR